MSPNREQDNSVEPPFGLRSSRPKVAFSFAYFSFGEAKEK
jgi:hypothetical protein